jgi:hypothetical protein
LRAGIALAALAVIVKRDDAHKAVIIVPDTIARSFSPLL